MTKRRSLRMSSKKEGLLLVVSGPSGVGKGTILRQYQEERGKENVFYSVSVTTREPRNNEVEGVHYHYISQKEFDELVEKGGMLEYAVYGGSGSSYGTPREPVESALKEGRDVILEIEVQGAKKVLAEKKDAVSIFVMPPSVDDLRSRIVGRDSAQAVDTESRIAIGVEEMKEAHNYDYVIVNDTVESALSQLKTVIAAALTTGKRKKEFIDEVIANA